MEPDLVRRRELVSRTAQQRKGSRCSLRKTECRASLRVPGPPAPNVPVPRREVATGASTLLRSRRRGEALQLPERVELQDLLPEWVLYGCNDPRHVESSVISGSSRACNRYARCS